MQQYTLLEDAGRALVRVFDRKHEEEIYIPREKYERQLSEDQKNDHQTKKSELL